jgi:hypothetical protein
MAKQQTLLPISLIAQNKERTLNTPTASLYKRIKHPTQ